ncbi:molybdopterin dinucleotide binding domain-containing protein, partial [Rhodococcus chondri]
AEHRQVDLPGADGHCGASCRPDTAGILAAAASGELGALVIGGVDVSDLPDPAAARAAVEAAPFVVSLELRAGEITDRADVVFPVAPVAEKSGTFLDWEGRERPFEAALRDTGAMPDLRILSALAEAMDIDLGLPDTQTARAELARLAEWGGAPAPAPDTRPAAPPKPVLGEAILAGWRMLLDRGRLQDGEPYLAGTARAPVVRLSAASADEIGARDGEPVTVATDRGEITLPLVIGDLPDRVVWLPLASPGSLVHEQLAAVPGDIVSIRAAVSGRQEAPQ